MSLTTLPQDVLLELVRHLDVADLLNFLSICRVIREIQAEKSLWLDALLRIKEVQQQPLPIFDWGALDTLSLAELQNIVQRTNRLMNNWKSESPRPVHIGTISVGNWTNIIVIPGANLVLCYAGMVVTCWDTLTCHHVASLDIPKLQFQTEVSTEFVGQALIGGCIFGPGEDERMVAVRINYGNRAQISMTHVISPARNNSYGLRSNFFVDSRVVGFCTPSSIVFWSMDANTEVQEKPQAFLQPGGVRTSLCVPLGRKLHLFHNGTLTEEAAAQSVPFSVTSEDWTDVAPSAIELPLSYPSASSQKELVRCGLFSMYWYGEHVFRPDYGVFAATARSFTLEGRQSSIVHFWPGHAAADGDLDIGAGHFYKLPDVIRHVAVGPSGRYMLIVFRNKKKDHEYLGLLHLESNPTPHVTFRKLNVGAVTSFSCHHISLDDSLGLVLVADDTGTVTVYSFV
ncbi:hypothetical protein B0H19DRAFT_1203079 [Mycena capillaripes]|nr:hypothetical protein B0H19DRAFT_1203079 [Mycena capillaripes]